MKVGPLKGKAWREATDGDGQMTLENRPDPITGSDEDPLKEYAVPTEWMKQLDTERFQETEARGQPRGHRRGGQPAEPEKGKLLEQIEVEEDKLPPEEQAEQDTTEFLEALAMQKLAQPKRPDHRHERAAAAGTVGSLGRRAHKRRGEVREEIQHRAQHDQDHAGDIYKYKNVYYLE